MSEWKEVKLGELIDIKHGYAFKGDNIVGVDNGIVLVTPGNFDVGGGFRHSGKKFFNGKIPEEYILKKEDIIVTMTDLSKNADTLGYSALVPNDKKVYLHNQRIGLISIKSDIASKGFIYWLLRTPWYQRRIANTSTGVNVKHTSPKKIYAYNAQLPSLEQQEEIANVLSTYDKLIENNNRRIEVLEQTAEEIYKEWFVRMRFPGYENTKFDKGIPEGWEVKRVEALGEVVTGKTPSTKVTEYYGEEVMFVKTPDMHGNIFTSQTESNLSEAGSNSQDNKLLPQNSIMVSCIGTGGVVSINMFPAHTNQQINSIILEDTNIREWAFLTLKSMKQTIELFGATGATMTNLSKGKFEGLKLLYPSDVLLNKFNNITKPMFEELKSIILTNENLKKQRDLLLPRLMNGSIKVK